MGTENLDDRLCGVTNSQPHLNTDANNNGNSNAFRDTGIDARRD